MSSLERVAQQEEGSRRMIRLSCRHRDLLSRFGTAAYDRLTDSGVDSVVTIDDGDIDNDAV